jgi:hypothetical protein
VATRTSQKRLSDAALERRFWRLNRDARLCRLVCPRQKVYWSAILGPNATDNVRKNGFGGTRRFAIRRVMAEAGLDK